MVPQATFSKSSNHPLCKLYIEDDPYVSSDPEFVINKEDKNMEDFAILVVEVCY